MSAAQRVAILGGGPIGLACALLLAQRRIASVAVDARALDDARRDARLLALSRGTRQVLWPLLGEHAPAHAAIRDVHVSSAGEFGATHLAARDFGGVDLGVTVLYGDLLVALARAVDAQPLIEMRRPCRALRVEQMPEAVGVALDDGTAITAPLAVQAEGMAAARDGGTAEVPQQWALIADVHTRGPAPGSAFERFTREGPLALLPTPAAARVSDAALLTLALVWCMDEAQSARRLVLADAALIAELQQAIGTRIGRVASIGPRQRYPLVQSLRERTVAHRVVALGNAAQTLHPVAGQGFNLGLRDCVVLADALATHGDVGAALADYAARRRVDRAAIASVTRWLPPLFATRAAPFAAARAAGLVALDLVAPLRRQLAYLLMFGVRA